MDLSLYVGSYLTVDYTHTTWEKINALQLLESTDPKNNRKLEIFQFSRANHVQQILLDNFDGCYIPLDLHLFYQGIWNDTTNVCEYFYPMYIDNLVGFIVVDDRPKYMILGGDGSLFPLEYADSLLLINWNSIYTFTLIFYGCIIFFIFISGLVLLCDYEMDYKTARKKGDTHILLVIEAVGVLANAMLNLGCLVGLFSDHSPIVNQEQIAPVTLSSLSILGFVFWLAAVIAALHLHLDLSKNKILSSETFKIIPYLFFQLLTFFSLTFEIFYIFCMLQWNWFGPSRVI
eukprot:TRINITY_DN4720_c0_g4_i3.p1 TRINITY_DN4720_c0_g4~~TRINITY_DN4720_c0_g4_i3.p1  ORF type:complete len:339 (-),score=34.36 TRINITY_DN4720_c0_g4_i3:140-1006(-)